MYKILFLFGALALVASHGALAQDLAAAAPKNVVLDNDHVRVIAVILKPGEKLPAHGHPVHLALVKSGGKLKVTNLISGKVENYDSKPGDTFWFDCVTLHAGENVGKTTMEWSEIEFKNLPCKSAN